MAPSTIYFGKTRKVPNTFLRTTIRAVQEMLTFISQRHRPKLHDISTWGDYDSSKPYASWEWYQDSSLLNRQAGYGRQADADVISEKLCREPHRRHNPHLDIALFDYDFTAKSNGQYLNFIFGLGGPALGLILSIARFKPIKNYGTQQLAFRRIVQHEFGHLLGLVYRNYNCGRGEIYEHHCAGKRGPCAMRQILSIEELIAFSLEENNAGVILCLDCQKELASYFK